MPRPKNGYHNAAGQPVPGTHDPINRFMDKTALMHRAYNRGKDGMPLYDRAAIDIGSTGRVHITTLIFLVNKPFRGEQLGVSAITCPPPVAGNLSIASCTSQIIDTAGSDRPWITSDGKHVQACLHFLP